MKSRIFLAMLAGATIFATACSKDDSKDNNSNDGSGTDPVVVTAAAAVAGTYNGELSLEVLGEDQGSVTTSFTLAATGDNSVSVTISVFEAMGTELGPIVLQDVEVSDRSGSYGLAVEDYVAQNVPYGESTVNVTTTLDGEIDAGKTLTANLTMTLGAMPFPVTGVFIGK